MAKEDQLPIPKPALSDPASKEILRIWLADDKQFVSLQPGAFSDPAAWGMLLVDVMRHIADAYEATREMHSNQVLDRIKEGLFAEMLYPTDEPIGYLIDDSQPE